jgi:hypothetical protein
MDSTGLQKSSRRQAVPTTYCLYTGLGDAPPHHTVHVHSVRAASQLVFLCTMRRAEYMHSINSMQTDNLDPEIIAAARARRSRER